MTQTTLSGVSPAAEPEQPRPGSRAARLALPRAVDALKALAVEHGVCIRPIALRRTDLTNGQTELIDLPCGATLEAKCPPCAQKARRLRQVQIREGWHRTDEPLPPPHPATEEQKALPPFLVHELRAHRFLTVPVNVVQRVMGHEQASTTLNRYTHAPDDFAARVRAAFDDPMPLCCLPRRTIFPATIRQLVSSGVSWANSGGAQGT
jgi:hypothetical protein